MSTMGERIRDCRQKAGLTMEELAEKVGVQKSAVNKWEKGNVENLKRSIIQKLAELFNVNPAWLMGWTPITGSVENEPEAQPISSPFIIEIEQITKDYSKRQQELLMMYAKLLSKEDKP